MILGLTIFMVASYTIVTAETSRLPLVAGWDKALPAWFTKLSPRFGTPVRSLVVIVALAGVASVLASSGAGREEAFQLLQTSNQISFGIYYCMMFAVPLAVGDRFGARPGFWLKLSAVPGAWGDCGAGGACAGADCGCDEYVGVRGEGGGYGAGDQSGGGGDLLAGEAGGGLGGLGWNKIARAYG